MSKNPKVAKKAVVKKATALTKATNKKIKENAELANAELGVPAPKKSKGKPTIKKSTAKLISFSVTAVIPTQQYGNIQPKIEVMAETIEEARALVMPVIENFYETYAEVPLNGKPVKFLGKVTETQKVVDLTTPAPAAAAPVVPEPPKTTAEPAKPASAPVSAPATATPTVDRPEPFKKAEKAISLADSHTMLDSIQAQIEKSVKINPADKPELYQMLTTKKNSIPF